MKTSSAVSGPRRFRGGKRGFSLVEVTIALGVTAFALVALFGMLPTGLNLFRSSMDVSVKSQIAQQLVSEAMQTDFETILTQEDGFRYFNDEGIEVPESTSIYTAKVSFDKELSGMQELRGGFAVPKVPDLVRFQVQIIRNPGHRTDLFPDAPNATPTPGLDTFTAFIPRNESKPKGGIN